MKNVAGLCLFGVTLFCVGIVAGRQLKQSLLPNSASAGHTPLHQNLHQNGVLTTQSSETYQSSSSGIVKASFSPADELPSLSPSVQPLQIGIGSAPAVAKPPGGAGLPVGANPPGGAGLRQVPVEGRDVRSIIRKAWPEVDAETADVWAEEMADMSDDDIQFMIEQRKRSGLRSFGSSLPKASSMLEDVQPPQLSIESAIGSPATGTSCPTAIQQAIAESLKNLSAGNAIGYRRSVTFVSPTSGSTEAEHPLPTWTFHSVRDFRPAGEQRTFKPLHAALPADPELMFCLADSLLTRRGDFQILPDQRLGLMAGSTSIAVDGVEPIPENSVGVEIKENGTVQLTTPEGATKVLGKLRIARIRNPGTLTTTDGVLFQCPPEQLILVGESDPFRLLPGFVELSNVELEAEWKALEHFRKLEGELMRFSEPEPLIAF
ncbi:MAG: hypothetical protein JNL58_02955 [Planctomyces sp.]|nr:hypothetical protein [Planctomyces sp.]